MIFPWVLKFFEFLFYVNLLSVSSALSVFSNKGNYFTNRYETLANAISLHKNEKG